MKVTITSILLKSPFHFYPLAYKALGILKQIKESGAIQIESAGLWTLHYTISLRNNEEEMKAFALSGKHLQAMKESKKIAKTISTYTYDAEQIPDWKTAKLLLKEQGKQLHF
jgi:hypothetical protein